MRVLFGCVAVLLVISLATRYGYKGADTVVGGVISAVVFGAIAGNIREISSRSKSTARRSCGRAGELASARDNRSVVTPTWFR